MKQQTLFKTTILVCFSFLAAANMYAQGGGFLLGRSGLELSERLYIANDGYTFQNQTRIGGKLDNIVAGVTYIGSGSSFYYGSGFGADLGYDMRFKRGWGINSNLHYAATANKATTYQNQFSDVGLTLAVYKQIEGPKRRFFFKPFVQLGGGFQQTKTTRMSVSYNSLTMVYTPYEITQNTTGVTIETGLGAAFAWRLGRVVVGFTPFYTTLVLLSGAPSATFTVGYTFRNQSDFDGKEKVE